MDRLRAQRVNRVDEPTTEPQFQRRPTSADHRIRRVCDADAAVRSVVYRLRADLRRGWRTLAVIALLVGLSGGVVLTALAAAHRTDTAFARMRAANDAWDLTINPNSGSESALTME